MDDEHDRWNEMRKLSQWKWNLCLQLNWIIFKWLSKIENAIRRLIRLYNLSLYVYVNASARVNQRSNIKQVNLVKMSFVKRCETEIRSGRALEEWDEEMQEKCQAEEWKWIELWTECAGVCVCVCESGADGGSYRSPTPLFRLFRSPRSLCIFAFPFDVDEDTFFMFHVVRFSFWFLFFVSLMESRFIAFSLRWRSRKRAEKPKRKIKNRKENKDENVSAHKMSDEEWTVCL